MVGRMLTLSVPPPSSFLLLDAGRRCEVWLVVGVGSEWGCWDDCGGGGGMLFTFKKGDYFLSSRDVRVTLRFPL